ncbi:hypothetical protein EDD85DRAFT_958031 [Armillaria nabsnona]|nr:hypothetical protein EDD85DRAFT_958031 [Armillaria nabsnona]
MQSMSRQWQHARLEMFTPPTPAHTTSSRALQNERWMLEMSSDSSYPSTPAPSTETLFGDFRVLEQECKKLEKRAVRVEGKACKTEESLNRMMLMYRQAQTKMQNTEESFNQLMHMHRQALARLENAEESIDGEETLCMQARNATASKTLITPTPNTTHTNPQVHGGF